jgi:hypothetical protein
MAETRTVSFKMQVAEIVIPLILTAIVLVAAFFLDTTMFGDFGRPKK